MQPFQALHLLFLVWLTTTLNKAQDFSGPGPCGDTYCGAVAIKYPFGIGKNCSFNEWFHVDCKSSTPYLPALNNVQLLTIESSFVLVGMPVIYTADCKNPVQNSILDIISTTHGKSPFRFSGDYNKLVFQGCGGASIMEENGSIITGCSTTCRNDIISDINNCFGVGCCEATIPRDLESFTLNARQDGDGTCGSAFLIYPYSAQGVDVKDQNFVPVLLSWGCANRCGEVSIPNPFGIGINCSRNEWYNVDCKSSTPYLSAFKNLEVLGVDLESQSVTVNVSMISDCENPIQNSSLVLSTESPFEFSKSDNLFIFEGCGNAAIVDEDGTIVGGCSTTCGDDTVSDTNNCFGVGCCKAEIPYGDDEKQYKSLTFNLTRLKRQAENGSCAGSAFLVDRTSFNKRRFSRQFVPITLYWSNLVPESQGSKKCRSCQYLGGYCTTNDSGTTICRLHGGSKKGVILGVSISMGLLFLTVASYALYKIIKKTKAKRRKQRFFKRNGGILLKQQQETDISLVDKTILFTSNDLEKATDHFNENRILGRGGQGTVYKGMLADGRIVAIKKSKVIDERQLEQFINEVVVLSQVNHRNVVKLLGCCLETEVPLLVSEFIPNGTLYDLIQDETGEFSFSLNIRLQIASEVSGAVSYLHSATSIPIYHRDIKTTNILLDEKYRAKVSDFGTSRLVSVDQTHLTTLVKGTFGYLDPEYFQSSQFTEKSDVYSFGVVLLELLTREKPISLTRFGENRSLATHFLLAMEEGRVMSIFDSMVVKEGFRTELMAVANLAMRCLNFSGKNRPTMKEVFIELEGIRLSHVPPTVETKFGQVKPSEDAHLKYDESASTSMTFDDNLSG